MCVSLSLFSVFFGLPNIFTQMPRIVRQSFPRIIIEPSPSSSPLQTMFEPRAASCERRAQSDYAPLASALFCSFASRILQETLTHLGRVCWYPNLAQAIAATSKFRFQMDRAADKKKNQMANKINKIIAISLVREWPGSGSGSGLFYARQIVIN